MKDAIDRAGDLARMWLDCVQLTSDSQSVVAMRLMGLGGVWMLPATENRRMWGEKLPAFTEAWVAGTLCAARGDAPDRVLRATLDPLSRRARLNRRRLTRHGPALWHGARARRNKIFHGASS